MTKFYVWMMVLAVLATGYHHYGFIGMVAPRRRRGKHCASGRSVTRIRGAHRYSASVPPVEYVLRQATGEHMLPSRYYGLVTASRRGMAHAA